jgi:hypothetical protein
MEATAPAVLVAGTAPLIYKQMVAVMRDTGAIGKGRFASTGGQGGYNFRGIDDLYNALQSALSANGVFCVPQVLAERSEERQSRNGANLIYRIIIVQYTFYAEDGSSVVAKVVGEAMDSGDKASNKAMSAAQKYAFLQVFAIPTEEPKDSENDTHEVQGKSKGKAPKEDKAPSPPPPPAPPRNRNARPAQSPEETAHGAAQAAAQAAAAPAGKPNTPSTYKDDDVTMQKRLANILKVQKVPEQYWEEIGKRLNGRPSTDLKAVLEEVRTGAAP